MTLWLPETQAFEPILNRAEAERAVETHLKAHVEALKGLVDYGTFLIPRCWGSSRRTVRDMVALPILLKQTVAMLDGATELLARGCVEPAVLQLRAMFEASIYLDWIFKSKSPARARAYYVWNVRRQLRWVNRGIEGTPDRRAYTADLRGLVVESSLATPQKQDELSADAERLSKSLNERHNAAWNKRFDAKRGRRPYDVDWYQVLFKKKRSLRFLAATAKRMPEYRAVYEFGSETMHSSRSDSHVRILDGGKVGIRSLRELTDFPVVAQLLMATAIQTYRAALREYRFEELDNFARKYVEAWRSVFMSKVRVSYQYHEVPIG